MTKISSPTTLRWRLAQWLEIRWWRNYLADKSPADYLQQKAEYWQRLLKALSVEYLPEASVLDAGCGPAGVFLVLDKQKVDAVDPLLDQYQQLPHFAPTDYPWATFHANTLESFHSPTTYDTVFCLNAINHVDEWDRGLDKLSSVTKPGGQLVLGIDVHKYKWLKFIFQHIPGDVLHPHQHDRTDYRNALLQRDWTIIKEHTWKEGLIFDYWLLVLQKKQ